MTMRITSWGGASELRRAAASSNPSLKRTANAGRRVSLCVVPLRRCQPLTLNVGRRDCPSLDFDR